MLAGARWSDLSLAAPGCSRGNDAQARWHCTLICAGLRRAKIRRPFCFGSCRGQTPCIGILKNIFAGFLGIVDRKLSLRGTMRNRHPIVITVSWIALGVGSALIYSGWQAAPGREELLALGFTMVLIALVVLSLRYLF